jgi:hypothetical protein
MRQSWELRSAALWEVRQDKTEPCTLLQSSLLTLYVRCRTKNAACTMHAHDYEAARWPPLTVDAQVMLQLHHAARVGLQGT